MSRDAGEILKEALALRPEARAALADYLWDSLDPEVDADAEEAWRQATKRRIVDLDSGKIAAIPWSEARVGLLAKIPK
jgi:putative addiction module component (TIGR02574 family)